MFIPASALRNCSSVASVFQSRDWVDVYSGPGVHAPNRAGVGFNPATGLMFIPADARMEAAAPGADVSIPRLG